ncbi:unnamed protein product, partial [Scytosiphon promiscuus]
MKLFWNIFQPGDKEKPHATGKASTSSESLPQLLPEPRPPAFEPYPPAARSEWVFATDSTGRRLQSLWNNVNAREDQPVASRPGFFLFVTDLRRALESRDTTCTSSVPTTTVDDGDSSPPSIPHAGDAAFMMPALALDARGIPAD